MSMVQPRRLFTSERRLRAMLVLVMAWEVVALIAEVTFGGPLAKVSGDQIGGLLAGRASFGGAPLVLLVLYVYAFAQGPLRHRGILWLAALEQLAIVLFSIFHVTSDIEVEGMIIPVVVSILLLIVLLTNMPREQTTS